jgi:hypothetical protein
MEMLTAVAVGLMAVFGLLVLVLMERRVVRDGTTATLETAAALTGKVDGTAASAFTVPGKAKNLVAVEAVISAESLAAVQENGFTLRLQGDGLPGGPYYFVLGGHSSGTTSTAGMNNLVIRVPVNLPVNQGDIDGDIFATGDTIIVANCLVALVFDG